ncbi:hypothetical protein I79_006727 [Cricetulus griseus]|uniref:Uncharacterized protein n=1 Tax=Cricetulus griseus TaxID=10029 RepID=G3H8M3_CRIGR|nr:hypothetical protein I79_006727 [Cricetulus griseus]
MYGMCCHFPNIVKSWSNIFNYLKALEYKVRNNYCVNKIIENLLREGKENLRRKIT